jgi:hypothetical protein
VGAGGGATIAQTTDPQYTTLGGKAALIDFGASGGTLYAPAFRVWRIGTTTRATVSLRVRFQLTAFSGACGLAFSIANVAGTPATPVLRTLYPMNHPTAADADKFDVGVSYDLIITAINLAALDLNQPLRVVMSMVNGAPGDQCAASVDAVQVTQTTYDPGTFIEGSAATELWNAANRFLEENSAPLVEYAVQLRDLSRLDGSPWTADAIEIGQTIELRDRDLNLVARPRVMQYVPNDLEPLSSRVLLSNRRKTLARLLSRLALLSAANQAGARSATQTITGAGTTAGLLLPAPTIGPIYGESSARGGATQDGMVWLWLTFEKNTKEIWIFAELAPRSPAPTPDPHAENSLARVIKRQEGTIPNQDNWETLAFMATNVGWYKKVYVFGVSYDGTKGLPIILEAQAVDTISPTLLDITDLAVARAGDTATLTWTNPGGMSSSQPIYILVLRNGFVLKILPYVAGATTLLDTGLIAQNVYDYAVFPWTAGISGATAPTDPPAPSPLTPAPLDPTPSPLTPVVSLPPATAKPVITNSVIAYSYPGGNGFAFTYDTPDVPASGTATVQGYNPSTGVWADLSIPQPAVSGGSYATTTNTAFNTFRAVVYDAGGALYAVGDTVTVSVP